MEFWNHIYEQFDPVAVNLFGLPVHWYGMMYVLALVTALYAGKIIAKYDKEDVTQKQLDDYFIYVEIGVILGARIGYIVFYDPNTLEYLMAPWQIFNPFHNGEFVGIRGMSFHGAVIGFFAGSFTYYFRTKAPIWRILDIAVIAVPVGYVFGRIGNFLNQELVGRATDSALGIYVDGVLRHPSQLYEALLEGVIVFIVLFLYRKHKHYEGELILVYGFMYGLMRFIAEFWREPDPQLGFICCGWLTKGQELSSFMIVGSAILLVYFYKKNLKKPFKKVS
jgi:phosphatidylglycerol:prolipoprotein diacylglycerol transferase